MNAENPYTAPASDPTPSNVNLDQPHLATLGARFLGSFVDGLIICAIVFPLGFVLGLTGLMKVDPTTGQTGFLWTLLLGVVGFLISMAINYRFFVTTGQSIGKKVAKTRIVTMSGKKPVVSDIIFKRQAVMQFIGMIPVAGIILSLVNILFVFRKDRRCLHDLVAGTQVVAVQPGEIL